MSFIHTMILYHWILINPSVTATLLGTFYYTIDRYTLGHFLIFKTNTFYINELNKIDGQLLALRMRIHCNPRLHLKIIVYLITFLNLFWKWCPLTYFNFFYNVLLIIIDNVRIFLLIFSVQKLFSLSLSQLVFLILNIFINFVCFP